MTVNSLYDCMSHPELTGAQQRTLGLAQAETQQTLLSCRDDKVDININ